MSSPMWVLRRTSGLQEQDVLLATESSFQLHFIVLVIRSHSMERQQHMCLVATSEILSAILDFLFLLFLKSYQNNPTPPSLILRAPYSLNDSFSRHE